MTPRNRMTDISLPSTAWGSQWLLNFYRLVLAALFLILIIKGTPNFLGQLDPVLFRSIATAYLTFTIGWMFVIHYRVPEFRLQVYIQSLIDILAIGIFMYLSGGVTSGIGMLLIVTIAGGGLLMPGRSALLFAATGTITLLAVESYGQITQNFQETAYTQTGLLGAALFATALLAMALAQRARQSELLAAKRGIDLANMAELNAHIVNQLQSGILVVDDDANVLLMNKAAQQLLGQEKAPGTTALIKISHALHGLLQRWVADNRDIPESISLEHTSNAGLRAQFKHIGARKEDKGCVIYLEDTADINRQIQQSKLASLGRLTASIAHEIRNPLGAISHATQLLEESHNIEPSDKRLLDIIHLQSNRLNEIINNILGLSRRDNLHPEAISLEAWLAHFSEEFSVIEGLQSDWAQIDIEPHNMSVTMDANHLHQILWNLCTNAVKYGRNTEGELALVFQGGISPDSHAPYLDIIDSGPGIDKTSQAQLFEPFFTTSTTGTGLGLYISRELCQNNGGDLSHIPNPMGGSCFRIHFPISQTEDQELATRAYH